MTPGPTLIRECSRCGRYLKQLTLNSGNTFGATFWTDGKRDAPMLPDQPWLIKCPHCAALLWIDEQKQVATVEPWQHQEVEARFPGAREGLWPTLEEYQAFIETGIDDPRKQRYARMRAWWADNDQRRDGGTGTPPGAFFAVNLRAYAALLDEAEDNDRLMKAEALRELGEFEAAERLLDMPFDPRMEKAVRFIHELVRRRDAVVAQLRF